MKLTIKASQLKFLILGAGGLGLALRILLYATGIDGRGLLEEGHWAEIALWILTALTAAALFFFTRKIVGPETYRDSHPVSFAGAVGAFAAMGALGMTTLQEFAEFSSRLHLIVWVLGLCAAVSLGIIGVCRLTGKKPHFLLHTLFCLYLALRMVSQYQMWSSDPQLQDYCFYLCAYLALMLTAYHHAAFDADMGKHRALWFFSLAAVYLCCLSLKGTRDTLLLLCCGAWAFTNLTNLCVRRRQRPVLKLDDDPRKED